MFASPKYNESLTKLVKNKSIQTHFQHLLKRVDPQKQLATFGCGEELIEVPYDFLHVCPYQGPKDVVKNSPLCDASGYVELDKGTLQHPRFSNIFGLGDCTNLPTPKTAAAAACQSKYIKRNVDDFLNNKEISTTDVYDGYTSCPLFTGDDKLILAEFDYTMNPRETFWFDQGEARNSMFHLTKDILPSVYWNRMVTGNWEGPAPFAKIFNPKQEQQWH